MGYKEISLMDSGYFFCPYIPLSETPVVLDDEWHTRIVQQANDVHRTTMNTDHYIVIKDPEQIVNWRKDGF